MEALIEYFTNIPSSHRTLFLVSGLTIFWMIESAVPLFSFKYNKWKHAGINIFFTLTTAIINFAMAFILVKSSDWVVANEFGLIQWVSMPVWLYTIVGLMLLDLIGAYAVHYIEHRVKWMWRFHLIHHTDQNVDTTTANRHHPGESVFRFVFTTVAVFIVGAPMWMVFLYQTLSVILTQFNHSNVRMPEWLDRTLVWVICTPNMHRVHHHYRLPYTDTNFGNIFSIWDRIFGTYIEAPNEKLKYGVDTFMAPEEANNVGTLLKIPFMRYRNTIQYDEDEKL
ncbi:sterol desaturase family protein [Flavilitoribacter nigricans]|uniref:Sterol desaturase n=1 Tax=Flavilitoribacter nigricans (strain ATCC 23147 / DSM 23189 / NBRC 102662 / NCIMB 1420 / SS-2) TaxID=1122177 RepID=A0A2D0N8H9_FLAN2|nr:sterol desaturase family protein [Flavilitoribacter nigricans]PHN04821.1 sterol desaturase [Flavilitoribacter nigricans DSM 23189 = NBRC 102662]